MKRGESMELYIFSQDDKLLTILSPETGLLEAPFREELNQVSDTPFSFTIEADADESKHVVEENQVVFRDKEGELRLYVIKELDDVDAIDGPLSTAICEPAFMELSEHIIEDRRFIDKTADVALDAALEGTRWVGEVEVSLGTATDNFYYISSVDAVWKILQSWGGDFKDVVEFDEQNNITARKIKILQRRGADTGHRWEIDHNIEQIQRTVLSYPITALYGRGASLQTEGGGYTRYIDFADVEWKKSKGDPVDKPLGQKWVGSPDALEKYGRIHNGKLLHREGILQNQDIQDKKELLRWTWEQLPGLAKPQMNYKLMVHLLESLAGYEHEKASLGDTTRAIDRLFSRPIEIQARAIAIEYDLMDIEGTAQVEMGQFLNLDDDRLDRVIDDINNNRGNWEHPQIDESNYPNIIPSVPTNVQAIGGFKTIQLYWDYADELFIKHYEIYGSQVQGFIPSEAQLLGRGDVSAFAHEVDTDQVWYYRIRAMNYHGNGSEFSDEVTASTVRIITDDMLFGSVNADILADLSVDASKLTDSAVTAEKIANLAVGNAAIQNAAITNAKIGTAAISTAQIQDAAITNAKIYEVTADKVKAANLQAISADLGTVNAGRLLSKNNNMDLNLNTGRLSMQNADFSLGGGANIEFLDRGNKIKYTVWDSEIGSNFSAGLGVGLAIGNQFPLVYVGTNSKGDLDTLSPSYSGLTVNSVSRINNDDSANAMYGNRFRFINHTDYSKGLAIDFINESIVPWGASFDLGSDVTRMNRIWTNSMRVPNQFDIRNIWNPDIAWRIETQYDGTGNGIAIVPLNTGTYNYTIGKSSTRLTNIFSEVVTATYVNTEHLNGTLVGTSTKNAKMSIEDIDGKQAFDYFDMMDLKSFFYNDADITNPYNRKVSPIIEQLDPVLENLYKATQDGLDINSNLFLLAAAFKHYVKQTNQQLEELKNGTA